MLLYMYIEYIHVLISYYTKAAFIIKLFVCYVLKIGYPRGTLEQINLFCVALLCNVYIILI